MPRWILIAILVIVLFVAALVAYVWVGFVDLRTTLEPSSMEATMARMALDASRTVYAGPECPWHHVLTDDQIWTVVTFLDHIHRLPAEAQRMWAAPAR